ncbi:glycoprotein-N-acetylgalactosamine 3-beta-galactosyltransferase 1-B-like [Mizuhopecten yessoensis]|uniref:Glycoprotein-N-acetylgalactosamine 3-beta-galactosyltransferase 1 n=1 Tax=Mizuhopecten yessoensis TaxID=6573 RepID=A0A210QA58_MIZYE|nr:glycoprotein-N-acetylgalactosamine 3-beta-galactosyltransferase 1-B-like [Mizuhopecten yessoensis]OWF45589.1 Glycoprotein-N-acetylgalactosamine 3-beta-galactosyltransferase 1 [Mizuhopecten yessoensis]
MASLSRPGWRLLHVVFCSLMTVSIISVIGFIVTSQMTLKYNVKMPDINLFRYVVDTKKDELSSSQLEGTSTITIETKNVTSTTKSTIRRFQSQMDADDDDVASRLKKEVRVLCWIMTCPANLKYKTVSVKRTWATRCNVVVYISSTTDTSFPTVGLNVSEGRDHLTEKSMQAFKYVYDKHFNDADWFLKADDDTYVILENLRYLLKSHSHEEPVYFGHHFRAQVKQGYHSGGAGYVLSKEALRRLALKGNDTNLCHKSGLDEDVEIGRCMENIGVKIGNSTDALGRTRFHCFYPSMHLSGLYPSWYSRYDTHGGKKKGRESISEHAISFHYITPTEMYYLDFLIYHILPYGISSVDKHLN